ncbi:HelD family protein [Actinoplanes couchii]|uniref:DNA helicase n=1 Tax=Actinoplanes couchii TaxID=403638 RepID=A0ABQ3XTR7_9ACTN|nr:UvrD-helicase domain-containing protein [Actinoplanes couchii]MDR6317993.1 DNA helicase IV [Actinoplanes couchii]GID61899.1 DNA helicase [Actinoplanes couchii]
MDSSITEEQDFLDAAMARRDTLAAHLRDELDHDATDRVEVARQRMLRRQYEALRQAGEGLVFGRLDAVDGTVRHIGRIGLFNAPAEGSPDASLDASRDASRDEDEPLLVDWRAPAARPFYTATAIEPQGQRRRRHIRTTGSIVVGVDDEPLVGGGSDASGGGDGLDGLVGEGALLAALDERRTGQMTTAISTLQHEQDAIVRADATGPLIVQGGPGTGKTVVALHRVAYLLFTYRQMAERAVLVLGPSARFLDYIARVLPALGETAVVAATCDTLLPGVTVGRTAGRAVEEIKGRAMWQGVLERRVAALVPAARELKMRWDGDFYVIPAAVVAQALTSAVQGRTYHRARAVFAEQLHQLLADTVAEQRESLLDEMEEGYEDILSRFSVEPSGAASRSDLDGLLSEDEIDELRERIAGNATIARFVESVWPTLEPQTLLRDLLHDPDLLARLAPELTPDEITAVVAEPESWSSGDIPLLDALWELLGDVEEPRPQGEFTADKARSQRGWVYGHVVVDEAQELSEMQWRMVLRRCPSRSVTAVGDIDQTEAAHRHTTWSQAVRAVLGDRWTPAELTICYRTPREVMELTGPVLFEAGSRNAPPRAVRSSGVLPWQLAVTTGELAGIAAQSVQELQQRWEGGTVGVIAPGSRIPGLRAALGDVPLLTATQSKGLEWDATLLIDAEAIAAEPRGFNALYVALTRCTQELGRLTITDPDQPPG